MDDSLANKYAKAVAATLGYEARMVSYSKSGYEARNPRNLVTFNAAVYVSGGRIWWGDLDLTLSEPQVAALAARIGEIVYVLYEGDARFEREEQQYLDKAAVFSVTPTGHTKFTHAYVERTNAGTLQRRPPEADTRRRWRWGVLLHRPRPWRFWTIDRHRTEDWLRPGSLDRTTLLHFGARDGGATPLLVLGFFRANHLRKLAFEITWYPTHDPERCAVRPLIDLRPTATVGRRLELWLGATVWPARTYSLTVGYALKPRWR